jgi:hypothetical protein
VRSQVLYKTEQGYFPESYEGAELYDGAFIQVLGRGDGTVEWSGDGGRIEWTNFPSRRPDGVFLPNVTGSIHLDRYPSPVLYRMRGISLRPNDEGQRLFAGPVRWYTDEPDLLWLNDLWGFEEGQIDVKTLRFRTTVHVLHPEPPG